MNVKNISPKLLADDLISVKPLSFEEVTKGKIIKEAKNKFSHFNSIQELKEYILNELKKRGDKLNKENLYASKCVMMPFNIEKDVYIKQYHSNNIGCDDNKFDCIRTGFSIDLDPNLFTLNALNDLINEIKNESC